MTQTARQAEAYEAKIQRAQAQVKQISNNVFSVPSESEPEPHIVTTDEQGHVTFCTCKGWHSWSHCYHAIATERYIAAQEAQKVVELAEEYIRLGNGGLVLKSAQLRTVERGAFSLFR